jgi:hypothetical protein
MLYVPASHNPLHSDDVSAGMAPKRPAGQSLHFFAPPTLYCPTAHSSPTADVEPGAQKLPG